MLILIWFSMLCCAMCLQLSPVRRRFFATTVTGLEKVLQSEIAQLADVSNLSTGKGGISFEGTHSTGLEAVMWLRSSLKVMELLSEHDEIDGKSTLDAWLASVKWDCLLSNRQTLHCDTVLGQNIPPDLNHNHFTSLSLKNAVVDHFRSSTGERPSVDLTDPDVSLMLYLHRGGGKLYRVWSGVASMHKRGYRQGAIHKAALRETTAAALLLLTQWNKHRQRSIAGSEQTYPSILCDPMCGSGTIAVEAALMAADTAPGLIRYAPNPLLPVKDKKNPLHVSVPVPLRWIDLQAESIAFAWQRILSQAQSRDQRASLKALNLPPFVYANDHHAGAVELARQAAQSAGVGHLVDLRCLDAGTYRPAQPPGVIVTNPPWDLRLQGAEDSWQALAQFTSAMSAARTDVLSSTSVASKNEEISNIISGRGQAEQGTTTQRSRFQPVAPKPSTPRLHSKLDLWVLSGNERLNCRYLGNRPQVRIPIRAASNDLSFNRYSV